MITVDYATWLQWTEQPEFVREIKERLEELAVRKDAKEAFQLLSELVRYRRFEEFQALTNGSIKGPRTFDAALEDVERLFESLLPKK